ncbi:MAG: type II toxin-antitoxin system VapC family toxin [Anaerolineae bacterium]|jgi:predicted nucleic acid-binding protein
MKVYLDTCSLQRPLDSRTQIRIILEAEAVLGLLSFVEAGQIELVSSEALLFETNRNPNLIRRQYALEALSKASTFAVVDKQVVARARALIAESIRPLDALHLACAELAGADYLCTCDDQFLKRARTLETTRLQVISPIELIEEIETWS